MAAGTKGTLCRFLAEGEESEEEKERRGEEEWWKEVEAEAKGNRRQAGWEEGPATADRDKV